MDAWFRRCTSFEEEAEADREFWLQYSAEERVALVEEIRKEWADMTNASQPSKDQRDFLALLRQHEVRALIVGAHALAFHAKPRYTKDIDIFVEASEDDARRIVQLGVPPNRIDLMTSIDGLTFDTAWRNRVEGTFAACRCTSSRRKI